MIELSEKLDLDGQTFEIVVFENGTEVYLHDQGETQRLTMNDLMEQPPDVFTPILETHERLKAEMSLTMLNSQHVCSMVDFDALPDGFQRIVYHLDDFSERDLELLALTCHNTLVNACKASPYDANKSTDTHHVRDLLKLTDGLNLSR